MHWLNFVCYVLKQAPTQNLSEPDNRFTNDNGTITFIFGPQYLRAKLFQLSLIKVN